MLGLVFAVLACGEQSKSIDKIPQNMASSFSPRPMNTKQIAVGKAVFEKNCQICHGSQAQGAPNWRQRDVDGRFPPPPLDGSAHAWHHSLSELKNKIELIDMEKSKENAQPKYSNRYATYIVIADLPVEQAPLNEWLIGQTREANEEEGDDDRAKSLVGNLWPNETYGRPENRSPAQVARLVADVDRRRAGLPKFGDEETGLTNRSLPVSLADTCLFRRQEA